MRALPYKTQQAIDDAPRVDRFNEISGHSDQIRICFCCNKEIPRRTAYLECLPRSDRTGIYPIAGPNTLAIAWIQCLDCERAIRPTLLQR